MTSKNDITGDKIHTKGVLSKQGRENWDTIFRKQDAESWRKELYPNLVIWNANGWNQDDGVSYDTPIAKSDFERRLQLSTILYEL